MTNLKGWKTVAFGLFMILVPPALTYLGGVDWTSLGISPAVAALIGAVVIGLRAVTNSGIGKAAVVVLCLGFGLSGCSGLTKVSDDLSAGCADVRAVADLAGLVPGVGAITAYVTAGCDTAEGIAKLAADPTSATWLGTLKQKIVDLAAKVGVKLA